MESTLSLQLTSVGQGFGIGIFFFNNFNAMFYQFGNQRIGGFNIQAAIG